MLMQYFSYEELKDIKKQVVAQHSSQQHRAAAQLLKGLSLWSQAEELHKALKYADHEKTHDGEQEEQEEEESWIRTSFKGRG